ncbi:hypothetical protein GCM10022228_09960 [Halomonas cibimaris]|uniref:DUF3617 family protein n=2 Tax=Halomonas cibimaris TaxID=657012 RepID=A0ABP7LG78_9GAMM
MMNMKTLLAAAVLTLPLVAQAQTPDLQPGQWKFVSVTTVKGDVEMPERTDTERQCITAQDLQSADFGFVEEEQGCELLDQEIRADGLRYTMICRGEGGEATIDGEMRFMGERIEGDVTIDTDSPIGKMTMNTRIEGTYQGECSAD